MSRAGRLALDAGRLVMVGFRGTSVGTAGAVADQIAAGQVGGVVLFDVDRTTGSERNVSSPEQVRDLVAGLQALAPDGPLLVAVDQEGGRVARLTERHGFPPTVSARDLGAEGDVARTRAEAGVIAATLAGVGIGLNLAPVVDLDLNPEGPAIGVADRSYSADPAVVTRHARAFVEAHRKRGVATALKHFPGHGSAAEDSHLSLADITRTWRPEELEPYRVLIAEGLVDAVMTAHVFHRGLDDRWPATLSPTILGDLLRGDLAFSGVVLTDDLQMGAIAGGHGLDVAVSQSLVAGADVLLFANNSPGIYDESAAPKAVEAILGLVEAGGIPARRVRESADRARRLALGP